MIVLLAGVSYPKSDHEILGEAFQLNAPLPKKWSSIYNREFQKYKPKSWNWTEKSLKHLTIIILAGVSYPKSNHEILGEAFLLNGPIPKK